MANTVTLAQLRTRCRELSDMENSTFVSDSEILSYINASYAELYDLLVSRNEDYYTTSTNLTISSGNTVALPTDFYKNRGVDIRLDSSGNSWSAVPKFNFNNRNTRNANVSKLLSGQFNVSYRIVGSDLHITPTDNATGTYRLWYIPVYTPLSADGDTVDGISGWEEYIVVDVAMKMLSKEESSINHLVMMKKGLIDRIEAMAQNRDMDQPETVSDVTDLFHDPDSLYTR